LFDESRSPGQTAKLFRLSTAGLDLAMNVGRENQGDSLTGREGGSLAPERRGKYQKHQDSQQKFPHRTPHQKPARVLCILISLPLRIAKIKRASKWI